MFYPEAIAVPATDVRSEDGGIHILDYWRIIIARRWTILAILLTSMTVTFIWVMKQTPIYEASAAIEIDRDRTDVLPFKDAYQTETTTDDTLKTQFEVLHSRTLARSVIEDLHLDQVEEFRPAKSGSDISIMAALKQSINGFFAVPKPPASDEPDTIRPIVDAYLKRLNVNPVRLARIVNITFESKDPQLAARIINAHAEHFIEQNFQFKLEAAERAKQFLSGQLVTMKAGLEKSQDSLQEYSQQNEILFTDDGHNTATEKLKELDEAHTKALADRSAKESYYSLIADTKPEDLMAKADGLPQVKSDLAIETLTTRLTQAQHDDAGLAAQFEPGYLLRQRLQSQIEETRNALDQEKGKVVKEVENEYRAAVHNENTLAKELDQQKEVVNKINQNIIQYNIRKGEVDSNKALYDGLLTKLNEADVSSTLHASNIRIVDKAETQESPIRPKKTVSMLLSLMIGLALGTGLAFFQDYLDDSIKSSEELTRLVGLPSLGIVPRLGSLGKRNYGSYYKLAYGKEAETASKDLQTTSLRVELVTHNAPLSMLAEAYRSIRTSLLLSSPDHPPRTVLITSAVPSEGKTVTAINTAISLSQTGARVVIVDADMRKPRIHAALSLDNTIGLSAVLTGSANLKDVIQESEVPNLFVVPCGVIPPNPGELLVSARFRQILETLGQFFDYVVIDSPPINNVSDSRMLGQLCDRIVIVAKAFGTSRHQIRQAVDHMAESRKRIAGMVLNDVDAKRGSYYSSQYYYSGRYYGKTG